MDLKPLIAAAWLACGTLAVPGCAHQEHDRSGGQIVDDAAITAQVKSALLAAKGVNSLDIKVRTFDGEVQLSGFVDSRWQIDKAMQIASSVKGVEGVTNDLIHKRN